MSFNVHSVHEALLVKKQKHDKKDKKQKKSKEDRVVQLHGQKLRIKRYVRVNIGPVIGTVTKDSAIVMMEINNEAPVTIYFVPYTAEGDDVDNVVYKEQDMPRNVPKVFHVTGLKPDTSYRVLFSGVSKKAIYNRIGNVKTFPEKITKLTVAALSCDRPERVLDGETNMWQLIQEKVESNQVQVVLHLGDQVYGQKELIDSFVILRQAKQDGISDPEGIRAVSSRVQNRLADIYRFTWNLPRTAKSLASGSHLMIWSDNDLYNDFTIAKNEATGQAIENLMIHYGHLVYRSYQRQLWDPEYDTNSLPAEQHYHKYGPIGILLIDMRGNRIDWDGNQHMENPIVNEEQWKLINSVFADPELQVILVCSEIPFVGDAPDVAKKNANKPGLEFLKDHWVYSTEELERLLTTAFDWKAADAKRDVLFLAGDIHVGVDSIIKDSKTNQTIRHLTATPITNHVCQFFPALEGAVNERFSYVHKPLDKRNYGLIDISIADDGTPTIEAQLVADPHPIAHK